MTTEQALSVYNALIEQSMANGQFKQLQQLDIARQSYQVLRSAIENTKTHDNDRGTEAE